MYVRLTDAWTDPAGAIHGAGEVVDVDAVTLAELEERGVVEDLAALEPDPNQPQPIGPGPGSPPKDDKDSLIGPGPGSEPKDSTDG